MPKAPKPYRTARGTHHGMAERPQRHFETESPVTTADPRLGEALGLKPDTDDYIASTGAPASAEALQRLLESGRPEFKGVDFVPHRPERPQKFEGGKAFNLVSPFEPKGDQPQAIDELVKGTKEGERTQVLLGVIGWVASISFISPYTVWLLAIAYLFLLAGVLLKGL